MLPRLLLGVAITLLALPSSAQRHRLLFEPAASTVQAGEESAIELRFEPAAGVPTPARLNVTLSGAEGVVALRAVSLAPGESATIEVSCAAAGTHRLAATADGARSGRALIACARPSLRRRSALRPASAAAFSIRAEAVTAARAPSPIEVRYAPSLGDDDVQEVLGWLAEGRSIESVDAAPEQLALARELVGAMNRPGSRGVQVLPAGLSASGLQFVRNRVLLPGRAEPVDIQQAATSEQTRPHTFEPGELNLLPLADSSWPLLGDWEPIQVAAVWERDGVPQARAFPLAVELRPSGLPGLRVRPQRLEIAANQAVSAQQAELDSQVAGSAELRAFWEGRLSERPSVVEFRPALPAALRVTGVAARVRAIARARLHPVIELVSDLGAPAEAVRPVRVGVVLAEREGESWSRELEIAGGEARGSVDLELDHHGHYRLEVSAAGLGRQTIDFEVVPSWWPLLAALAGGLLGALVRLVLRPEEARKRRWLRVLVGGTAAAAVVFLLQAFGALTALSGAGGWAAALGELPALNLFAAGLSGFFGGLLFEQVFGSLLGGRPPG